MIRALAPLLLLSLAPPRCAQERADRDRVDARPGGASVTVGTPVEVDVTVLVPTFMPQPPVWPDLQIADAITRLPERATTPVTRRIGTESWSGLTRRYEIVPQRAADFDLALPRSRHLRRPRDQRTEQATLPLPAIAFSATVPPGAEGLDPFLAALGADPHRQARRACPRRRSPATPSP